MKIVLAVDVDKQTVVKRTGHAPFFVVYEDEKLIQVIENGHGKGEGGHHDHKHEETHQHSNETHDEHVGGHKKDIAALAGNDIILVQAIGEHMKEALDSIGLKVKKIRKKDGETAEEVVKNFLENKETVQNFMSETDSH